jgi:hypothetical protein
MATLIASEDVQFTRIDLDEIGEPEDSPEAFTFDIILSKIPSEQWKIEFDYLYALEALPIRPPLVVEGNRMRVTYLPRYEADLQLYLDTIKRLAKRANIETVRTDEFHYNEKREQRKEEFRKVLKKVSVA